MFSADDIPSTHTPADGSIPDRRKLERRSSDRQGKYDRRRNRCGHCQLFNPLEQFCTFHQKPIRFDDFACPAFKSLE
ncbi:MAG: hypothetical protein VKJ04_02330 [Vampirovibrionales bacterium]|nr:hypothetical protein [Vampirovibrionales bacterium]